MGTGSFAARFAAFLAVAVFAAALAAVALWTREHHRRLEDAVASQAGFVLSEAKAGLEARLNLGLALADLPQVETLLDRARTALPGTVAVAVVDEAGTVIFSTDPVEVGDAVAVRNADPAFWFRKTGDERLYGIGLTTSFDTSAGTVLLRLPATVVDEPVQRYALQLSIGALAVAVPVGLLAWLAGLRLARGPRRSLSALADELEALAAGEPQVPSRGTAAGEELGVPIRAFSAAIRERVAVLAEAEKEVSRLDEMA